MAWIILAYVLGVVSGVAGMFYLARKYSLDVTKKEKP